MRPFKFSHFSRGCELGDNELRELYQLEQEQFPTPWSWQAWQGLTQEQSYFVAMVRDEQDNLIAFALFQRLFEQAHLLKILVDDPYREHGLGRELLQRCFQKLKHDAVTSVYLEVEQQNLAARALYQGLGSVHLHQRKAYYSNGSQALKMQIHLS